MLSLNNAAIRRTHVFALPSLMELAPAESSTCRLRLVFSRFPTRSLYAATKSFLTSFSLGLQEELRSTSVSVVTLCPGRILANGHNGEAEKRPIEEFAFAYQSKRRTVVETPWNRWRTVGTWYPGLVNNSAFSAQRLIPRRAVQHSSQNVAAMTRRAFRTWQRPLLRPREFFRPPGVRKCRVCKS